MSLFDQPSRKPLPQPTFEDVTYAGRKGLASMIPFVGGPASELLGLLSSPVAQRRDEWLADLECRLHALEDRVAGFRFDDLASNEQFVSATLQATQTALRTHDKEKLNALKNAVVNTALGDGGNDDRREIFLSLIDRLTPPHLRILRFFDESDKRARDFTGVMEDMLCVPGIKKLSNDARQLLFEDLCQMRLVGAKDNNQLVVAPGKRWTTDWGHDFIAFITAPEIKHAN